MIRFIRCWLINAELERGYARQRAARLIRSEAAHRGISKSWKARGERCRAVFN